MSDDAGDRGGGEDSGALWAAIDELFAAAADRPPAERSRYLDQHCADPTVRREVEDLLASDTSAGGFLEEAIAAGAVLFEESRDPLSNRPRVGKYELLERIGTGGFGSVWRARDPTFDRLVAIKSCTHEDPRLRERFLREAKIAAALQHPHLTTVLDFGEHDGVPYLVQELLPGEDLAHQILRRMPTTLVERLRILLQVASGLAHAHRQGVLHRDVKPANVRILPDGTAKLMDFGVAKRVDDDSRLTSEGVAVGTLGYMAPEQLESKPLDRRSDVFGFGVLAYELISYERAFGGGNFAQASKRLLERTPPPLVERRPDCPPALSTLVELCIQKVPAARWQSMEPVVEQLKGILGALEKDRPLPDASDLWQTTMVPILGDVGEVDEASGGAAAGGAATGGAATRGDTSSGAYGWAADLKSRWRRKKT